MKFVTRYGEIDCLGEYTCYENGTPKEITTDERIVLRTEFGELIPQYDFATYRKKRTSSITFYENGRLRRIALNEPMEVNTPIGIRRAELLTFYECGSLKRLFPLNGQLTAYWEEEDEYQLTKEESFELSFGRITGRVISVYFYKSGKIKSITLWPGETLRVETKYGVIPVRNGISFYMDGTINSLEPALPVFIKTPIGMLQAYDENAIGIIGDNNSVVFSKEGKLISLVASNQMVIAINKETGSRTVFSPSQELDEDGEEIWFRPLKMAFEDDYVSFQDEKRFDISQHEFKMQPYHKTGFSPCANCASCAGCNAEGNMGACS